MGFNLTNQYISQSFQQLVQTSGSALLDGTGSLIDPTVTSASHAGNADAAITASYAATASLLLGTIQSASYAATATSASHAVQADNALSASTSLLAITASYALNGESTNTGSFLTTASAADATITYTKGDGSVFTNTINNVASASYAATASVLLGNVVSASYALSSSYAVSASHSETSDLAADANDLIIGVKNTLGVTISKGQTLHATGVTGELVDVITASNSNGNMPAIGLALADINTGAAGNAIISGKLVGFSTLGFTAGENVYVGIDGAITATKPTGSALIQNIGIVGKVDGTDGELVVLGAGRSNDLPNITSGYIWAGNVNGVPTAVASSSIVVNNANTASIAISSSHAINADTASFLPSSTRLNITDITASNASFTSASIGYLKTTTGSATIIGDQYIILNADSPAARFAGIKVYDSGSGLTGSFEWDSIDDNWIQVETGGDSAGFLTGPSGSKGSEVYPAANKLIKGTGNHTTEESSITDTGTTVSTSIPVHITHNSTSDAVLKLETTEDSSAAAPIMEFKRNSTSPDSGDYLGQLKFLGENDADQEVIYAKMTGKTSDVADGTEDGLIEFAVKDNGSNSIISRINKNGISMVNGKLVGTASYADFSTTASHALNSGDWDGIFTGSAKITGSLTVDGDTLLNYQTAPNFAVKEIIKFPAFTKAASPGQGVAVNYNAMLYRNIPVAGTVNNVFQIGQGYDSNFDTYGSYLNIGNSRSEIALLASGSSGGLSTNQRSADIAVLDDGDNSYEGNSVARYYGTTIEIGIFNGRDIVVGNTRTGGGGFDTETLAIAGKDMYIGAANGISYDFEQTTVNYSGNEQTGDIEMWYTGSVRMIQTGSATGPALTISGSVTGQPQSIIASFNTASLDMSAGNFFNITLNSAVETHLDATNIQAGQTVTLVVTNNSGTVGTLAFSPDFKFPGGEAPVVTPTSNAVDILTFVTTDTTSVYGTSLLNFS